MAVANPYMTHQYDESLAGNLRNWPCTPFENKKADTKDMLSSPGDDYMTGSMIKGGSEGHLRIAV